MKSFIYHYHISLSAICEITLLFIVLLYFISGLLHSMRSLRLHPSCRIRDTTHMTALLSSRPCCQRSTQSQHPHQQQPTALRVQTPTLSSISWWFLAHLHTALCRPNSCTKLSRGRRISKTWRRTVRMIVRVRSALQRLQDHSLVLTRCSNPTKELAMLCHSQ